MVTTMRRSLLALLLLSLPLVAFADDSPAAVQARLDAELACVERVGHSLSRVSRLLTEARTQLASASPGSAAGRDAAAAVVSLEQRVGALSRELASCVPETARSQQVQYVEPPRDRAAEQVAQDAPSLQVLERDVALSSSVRVMVAEKVDGRGSVSAASVNGAVHSLNARLARCYDDLVDRGALVRGHAALSFTVTPRGTITRVSAGGSTIGDSRFTRCLENAGRHLHVGEPAVGGDATYSYTLGFGPN